MTIVPAFVKPVTFCCLNRFLRVAGERATYHVRTRSRLNNIEHINSVANDIKEMSKLISIAAYLVLFSVFISFSLFRYIQISRATNLMS